MIHTLYEFYVIPKPPGFHAQVGKQVAYKLTEKEMADADLVRDQEQAALAAFKACDSIRPFMERLRPGADGPDMIAACRNALAAVWQKSTEELDELVWSLVEHTSYVEGARVVCMTKPLVLA